MNDYTDDYRGWNIISDDDDISGGSHGTPVAGIVGAKGNNSLGVTGVNWNVKVMIVKNNFNTNEAAVLEAYSYPLVMRRNTMKRMVQKVLLSFQQMLPGEWILANRKMLRYGVLFMIL